MRGKKKEEEKVESIHFVLLFRIEYQSNLPFSIYLPGEMEANIGRPEQQKKKRIIPFYAKVPKRIHLTLFIWCIIYSRRASKVKR